MNNLNDYDNAIVKKIRSGEISYGAFLLSGSSFIAEAMASRELDWIVIDMEGSHATKENVLQILQALNAYATLPIVRIGEHNRHMIEFSLDLGAKGIMAPKVDTSAQALQILDACFYPPKGDRGMNCVRASGFYLNSKQYLEKANYSVLTLFQIESRTSIENIDSIAALEYVDILFVGMGDLSSSYGHSGNILVPELAEARKKVLQACIKYNKVPGIFAHAPELIHLYKEEGFRFIAVGNDIKFLTAGISLCKKEM